MTSQDATKKLRDYIHDYLNSNSTVNPTDLAEQAWEELGKDQAWVETLIQEKILRWLADEVRYIIGRQHSSVSPSTDANDPLVPVGESFERKSSISKRASQRSMFLKWKEHTGINEYTNLLDMTREQCQAAIGFRTQSATTNLRTAAFLETISAKLTGNKKIKNVYTVDELEKLWENVTQQYQQSAV